MYARPNFKTKKALKEAVAAAHANAAVSGDSGAQFPRIFSPGPFPAKDNGVDYVEGPHYPAPHTWYAKVQVEAGCIVKVLS